jgi:hypothetical protein
MPIIINMIVRGKDLLGIIAIYIMTIRILYIKWATVVIFIGYDILVVNIPTFYLLLIK